MEKNDLFESVLMINIAVAQIEASMTHGNNSVNKLISSVSTVRKMVNEIPGEFEHGPIDEHVNQSIVSLQFHDRLCQRLKNVSLALSKLAGIIEDNAEDYSAISWKDFKTEIHDNCTMSDERKIIERIYSGATINEALKDLDNIENFSADLDKCDDGELF